MDCFADEFGIANRHASHESLVADPDVEVIYVATPYPMHDDNATSRRGPGSTCWSRSRSR